jgi:hypothetical protein
MFLPQYSVFGDYQILCDLKSNIIFKAAKLSFDTKMMCINKKKFMEIGELFPVTMENLRQRSLLRRHHFMQAMQKLDSKNTFKALGRSFKKKFRQEILKSSANVEFKEN